MDRLLSRKFLLVLLAVIYAIGQAAGGAITPNDAIDAIWKVVAAYVAAEGAGDAAARLKPDIKEAVATAPTP